MIYLTEEQAAQAYAAIGPGANLAQVAQDANVLYGWLATQEPGTAGDDELHAYAQKQELTPERTNTALALLIALRRCVSVPLAPAVSGPVFTDHHVLLASLSTDQLQRLAKDQGIKGRSTMSREQLVEALATA